MIPKVLTSELRQEQDIKCLKFISSVAIFIGNIIICVEKPKESKINYQNSQLGKVNKFRVTIQKLTTFHYICIM